MLGYGFLGTRADWLMDLVIVSLVIIIPTLFFSWGQARRHAYTMHKKVQLSLAIALAIAVTFFEIDLRLAGGMKVLTKGSRYFGTLFLDLSTYIHLFFSVTTAILWVTLIIISLRRYDNPPRPTKEFKKAHRFWGTIGMLWMLLTGITGLELYIVGFAL